MTTDKKRIFFTADLHIGHRNIIKYCNRPFVDANEMDAELVRLWNAKVQPGDDVYIVGDVALKDPEYVASVLNKMNGNKHLIAGNHDKGLRKNKRFKACFNWIKEHYTVKVPDEDAPHQGLRHVFLFHYACRTWYGKGYGVWHIYGHSHGNLPDLENEFSFDVGVDNHGFAPLSYEEVKAIMAKKKVNPDDFYSDY